jgi:peptidyl-prolyl cis-trans isomerase D
MLQFIRSKASSLFFRILFIVLIVSFGIWGIGDVLRGKMFEPTVASVGGTTITAQEYQREYQHQLKRMSAALGGQFSPDVAKQMGLPQQVLDQMVAQALFSHLADQLGMRAPDDVLRGMLEASPAFRDQAGQFDQQRLAQFLSQQGLTVDSFTTSFRADLLRSQLYDAVSAGSIAPTAMADAVYGYRNEKRVADTLLIADSSIKDVPAPDQATLEKYLKDHAELYQSPEYRKLTILRLQPDAVAKTIKISDAAIAAEFDKNKDAYATPETRQFLTFTLPDEAKAQAAAKEISDGTDFAVEAKKATGSDVIDTGLVSRDGLLHEMADPAFNAQLNAVVGPVKTPLGWQLAKLMKIQAGHAADLAVVKDKIVARLSAGQTASAVADLEPQIDDALGGGASLEETAKKFGAAITIEAIPAVTRDGLDQDGKPIADLAAAPQLLPTAFATDAGQTSQRIDDGAGGDFVLRVDQVMPAATRPFDQVKGKVLADWMADARKKAAADEAAKIVERIKGGEDIKAIAQSLGIAIKRSSPFTRDSGDQPNDVPASLATVLFTLKLNEVTSAPNDSTTDPGQVVAKLVDIQPANPAANSEAVKQLNVEVSKSLASDLLAEFRRALQNETPVTVHADTVQSLI